MSICKSYNNLPRNKSPTDLATMEDVNKNDLAAINYGLARDIFGQSSPHLRDVRFDGVLAVL